VQLPFGSGKRAQIAVFARGEKAEEAKSAGAAVVGAEDLVAAIQAGTINFTKCIATPDMMPLVGKVARVSSRAAFPLPEAAESCPRCRPRFALRCSVSLSRVLVS
jgi:large subunit ribosomal protein L1